LVAASSILWPCFHAQLTRDESGGKVQTRQN
jgi:hypothetical protein